jgi:hypothetical protein
MQFSSSQSKHLCIPDKMLQHIKSRVFSIIAIFPYKESKLILIAISSIAISPNKSVMLS